MREPANLPSRRRFLKWATIAAAGCATARSAAAKARSNGARALFDGKTLDGWIQVQNSSTSFGGSDIIDIPAFAKTLAASSDSVAAFLDNQLDDQVKGSLAGYSDPNTDTKAARSALAKILNRIIGASPLYDKSRFQNVQLRPETQKLIKENPHGADLVRLNRLLLEDAFPAELAKSMATGWVVKEGAMASTGTGRGVIYTAKDYDRFRLMFTMRHVSGNPDHQACVLIFCTRPQADELPLDALGGIQFQVPKGGHWDYRTGHNNSGGDEFTSVTKPQYDPHEWSRVEIVANASTGTARMAVAQPVGSRSQEVLSFKDPTAGKAGPIAWQMHNAGLFDEYKDVTIETDPKTDDLQTTNPSV